MTTHTYKNEEGLPILNSGNGDDIGELPVFKDDSVKKKEAQEHLGGALATTGENIVKSTVSNYKPQSKLSKDDKDKLSQFLLGSKPDVRDRTADALKAVENTHPAQQVTVKKSSDIVKPLTEKVDKEARNTINDIMYSEGDAWKDPVKAIDDKAKAATNIDEFTALNRAADLTTQSLAPTGYDAMRVLNSSLWGQAKEDNQTANLLKAKAKEYNDDVAPLREINIEQPIGEHNQYAASVYSDQMKNAFIKAYANKNTDFKNQLESAGIDINDPFLYKRIGDAKAGQITDEYLHNKNVEDFLQKENSNLLPAYQHAQNKLLEDHPDYGVPKIANDLSRELQKTGYNNRDFIFNFDTESSREFVDHMARQRYKDNPELLKFYEDHISEIHDSMDKPSFFEGVASGIKNVYSGIGNTASTLFQSKAEDIKDEWNKEATNVSADPEGLMKLIRNSGHAVGFVSGLMAGGEVAQGTKLAGTPAGAQRLMVGTSVFGNELKEAEMKYKSPVKAWVNAGLNTTAFVMLQDIFPASKVSKVFNEIKPELNKIAENLSSGAITKEVARENATSVLSKAVDFGKKAFKQNVKTSAEMTALTGMKQGMDTIMGLDEQTYDKYHPDGELEDTFKTMFLSNAPIAGLSAYGEIGAKNKEMENSVFEAVNNPKRFETAIENLKVKDPSVNIDEIRGNFEFAKSLKEKLDAEGIDPINQKRFLVEALKEKVNKENLAKLSESNITRRTQKEIRESQDIQDKILNGEDVVGEEQRKEMPPEENEIISRVNKVASEGIVNTLKVADTEQDKIKFLKDQSLDVPSSLKDQLGGDENLTTDIISQNDKSDIESSISKYEKELKNPDLSDQRTEEIDRHLSLLHKGLDKIKTDETAIEPEANTESNEPAKASEANEPTLTIDEGAEKPPTNPEEKDLPFGRQELTGIAHELQQGRAYDIGAEAPQRGEGVSVEESIVHGNSLLADGGDAFKAAEKFKTDKKISYDDLALVRAQYAKMWKDTNEATDKFGIGSPEEKAAKEREVKWRDEVVKPMQTEWSKIGVAQQGLQDIDTGSFASLRRSLESRTNAPAKPEQVEKLKKFATENKKLKDEVDKLQEKLIKAKEDTTEKSEKKNATKSAKDLAEQIRKGKLHKPGSFSAASPASVIWDSAVEIVAKSVEAGGKIADAISEGLKYIKESDWYKSLSPDKKEQAEKEFSDYHLEDLGGKIDDAKRISEKLVDKKGNEFTADEAKEIWDYAKQHYLETGTPYTEMIGKVANDLGLTWRQVANAITTPKTKPITDEIWKKQSELSKSRNATKNYLDNNAGGKAGNVLKKVSGVFRGVSVFGHGGIFVGTHAAPTLFQPTTWKSTIPAFFRGWKYAYGNTAKYEQAMAELKSEPNYILAQRAGLKNNPDRINIEEFQKSQKFLGKLGDAGERGFNAIKVLRQDLFDYHFNKLSEEDKKNPDVAKSIAHLVNNATGATNLNIPNWINEVTFAGGMEAARWGKYTRNPLKATEIALKAIAKPSSVKPEERVFAKVWASRVGQQIGFYAGSLVANAAIQNTINPNNPVNLTNPNKSDWLKFKFGDMTVDPTSGMRGVASFIYGIGKMPFQSQKELKGDTRLEAAGKKTFGYARGKLSPFYSTVVDFFTGTDFNGNPLPTSSDEPKGAKHKVSWGEYLWQKAPLPVAEAVHNIYESAHENGSDDVSTSNILKGIMTGLLSGSTGFRVGETKEKPAKFTDNELNSKEIKYFTDKGLEMPNTSPTSETIKDKATKTKRKLSDYPQSVIDQYSETHKKYLRNELSHIVSHKYVFMDDYGDISLSPGSGKKRKNLDDLTKEQLEQILHLAQSSATEKTKKKLFKH